MSEISNAIAAKKAEIKKLQTDIAALHRATSIIGAPAKSGKKRATAKPTRRKMSAAARKALSKRMKAMWAAKKKSAK